MANAAETRSTFSTVFCSAVMLLGLSAAPLGCGANAKEIRDARTSGYEADFAIVYSESLAAVAEMYPNIVEDATTGVIKTAWHPVRVRTGNTTTDGTNNQSTVSASGQVTPGSGPLQGTNVRRKQYFIRFRVYVTGGKPWRVRVEGQASSWEIGEVPTPLRGAEVPHWVLGRSDKLRVAIFRRLKKYAVPLKFSSSDEKKVVEKPDATEFKALPPKAAELLAWVKRAATTRDAAGLRKHMADDFQWSEASPPSADTAVAMWSADGTLLEAMARAIDGGCAADASGKKILCPRAVVDPSYRGYRLGVTEIAGVWKLSFFYKNE